MTQFEAELVSWTASRLDPYITELERLTHAGVPLPGRKEINDAVWGTVVLEPLEILVLDSPLLQRLRHIRQLGVVHLVYPSAAHTRFEHSIGAVAQVTRVIESINEHAGQPVIDASDRKLLRLAALCHDIGHGAMSHVSERALRNFDEVDNLPRLFGEPFKIEAPALSEIAAYFMLGSSSFRLLIDTAERLLRERGLPQDAPILLQRAVIGLPISKSIPLLHELISGPFDADKLDYMTRDAQMSGVPIVTDVPRLVQKVRAVELPTDELPPEVQQLIDDSRAAYWLTGIAMSGGRTLDELLIGRTLLHDKLYRHQKVRACEVMVASIIRQIGSLPTDGAAMVAYRLDDEGIFGLEERDLRALAGRPLKAAEKRRAAVALDLADRLRRRELFGRAYAFAQNMPLDSYRTDRSHVNGLRRLGRDCNDPEIRGELAGKTAAAATRIAEVLNSTELIAALPTEDLKPYLWIDPPQAPTGTSVIAQAYLLGGGRDWLKFAEDTAEAPGWSNAYLLTRDLGYFFSPAELTPFVFLAAEQVLREEYGVRTPQSMYGYAKQDARRVQELKRRLDDQRYYATAPSDLRPLPDRLQSGDVKPRLAAIVDRLAGYQGPIRSDLLESKSETYLNSDRVRDWLRQLEDDELIDAGLGVLANIEVIGRHQLVAGLHQFLETNVGFHGGHLCQLGTPKDSSAILTYEALDAGQDYGMTCEALTTALPTGRPIVFVEDFVGRGAQAIGIMETWLGVPVTVELNEERGPPLDEFSRDRLANAEIAIVFSAGTAEGVAAVEERCRALGLTATVTRSTVRLPSVLDDGLYRSAAQRERFVEFCREVGRELLLDPEAGHDRAWAEARALGYGNQGYLVVFPYNTPAQTLTCLWADPAGLGRRWEPLLPRRKKT